MLYKILYLRFVIQPTSFPLPVISTERWDAGIVWFVFYSAPPQRRGGIVLLSVGGLDGSPFVGRLDRSPSVGRLDRSPSVGRLDCSPNSFHAWIENQIRLDYKNTRKNVECAIVRLITTCSFVVCKKAWKFYLDARRVSTNDCKYKASYKTYNNLFQSRASRYFEAQIALLSLRWRIYRTKKLEPVRDLDVQVYKVLSNENDRGLRFEVSFWM